MLGEKKAIGGPEISRLARRASMEGNMDVDFMTEVGSLHWNQQSGYIWIANLYSQEDCNL